MFLNFEYFNYHKQWINVLHGKETDKQNEWIVHRGDSLVKIIDIEHRYTTVHVCGPV